MEHKIDELWVERDHGTYYVRLVSRDRDYGGSGGSCSEALDMAVESLTFDMNKHGIGEEPK